MVNSKKTKEETLRKGKSTKKRPRREIQVVTCQPAFPISTKPKAARPPRKEHHKQTNARPDAAAKLLDWNDTVREVHSLGSTGFTGKQKGRHNDEQYKLLTGRAKKKHQIPLPILRGMKKKAAQREARQQQEAKDAGIVLPATASSSSKKKKKQDSTSRVHGPSPSIGFMSKGVFRVGKEKR